MTEQARVQCSSCGQSYRVDLRKLGCQATCQKCGEQFVLSVSDTATRAIPPPVPPRPSGPPPVVTERPKGFLARMKDKAVQSIDAAREKAASTAHARMLSGPCSVPENSSVAIARDGSEFTVSTTGGTEVFRDQLSSITHLESSGVDQLMVQLAGSEQFVFAKTVANSVEGIAEKLLTWMEDAGVLAPAEAESRTAAISKAVAQCREEQKAVRSSEMAMKYLHGPFSTRTNALMFLRIDSPELIGSAQVGINGREEVFRIPLTSIRGTEVETAERMTFARTGAGLLLAGPVGALIGGFGFKKKDKLLRIDFDDVGGEASIVFGKGIAITAEEVSGRILAARREHRRSPGEAMDGTDPTETVPGVSSGDVAASIRQLAELKSQGLLTEDEFSAKKSELLSRM